MKKFFTWWFSPPKDDLEMIDQLIISEIIKNMKALNEVNEFYKKCWIEQIKINEVLLDRVTELVKRENERNIS